MINNSLYYVLYAWLCAKRTSCIDLLNPRDTETIYLTPRPLFLAADAIAPVLQRIQLKWKGKHSQVSSSQQERLGLMIVPL